MNQRDFEAALPELGLSLDEMRRALAHARTPEQASKALEEVKATAKRNWKRRAFELHPDRNNGDPDKAEQLKKLNAAMMTIDKLRVVARRPPPPPRPTVTINFVNQGFGGWGGFSNASSTSSATTSTGFSGFSRVYWTRTG
jgi:hypothetical protein